MVISIEATILKLLKRGKTQNYISSYKVDFKKLPGQAMEMELERLSSVS